MKKNKIALAEIHETYQSTVDDIFHVFSAIYYPKEFQPINNFSHVNLFPKLFKQLAPHSINQIENLEQKANYSIFEERIMAIDGKPENENLFWSIKQ